MMSASDLELLRLIEQRYQLEICQAESLGGEVDTNLYIKDVNGREFTVKRSWCSNAADVRWQYPLLAHLESRLQGITVPVIEAAPSNALDFQVTAGGQLQVVRVARWVPGRVIGDVPSPSFELLREWGLLAAKCVLALSDYPSQRVPTSHAWDVRRSPDAVRKAIPYIEDRVRVKAVELIMRRAADSLLWLNKQPQQVIHQDLNDFNVLVDGANDHVTGLLDVGDSIFGPRVAEIVVAAAYGMLRQTDPHRAFDEVVAGYSQLLPLSDFDHANIFQLAALRLCVNATTWTMRTSLSPNEYGQRRMAATWSTLELISISHGR